MATINEIQKRLDNKTLDPFNLSPQERDAIDSAIDDGVLKGPKTRELMQLRRGVAGQIAQEKRVLENPIQEALDEQDSFLNLKGRPGAVLAGDLTGVAVGYKMMSGKLFGAAKSGNLWKRGPLSIGAQMNKVGNILARGPGPMKLAGGALKLVGKVADLPERVVRSPLGQAEIVSTLTGAVGAGAGSITYDGMNKAAGKTIAGAFVQGLADLSDKEIKTNMTYNAANEFKDSLIYGGAASAFTPFLTGVLGKVGRKILPTKKGPEMDKMLDYIRENDLPAPFISHIDQSKGAGRLAGNFFKTAGVFPGIASMGESAISKAEVAGANLYLNQFLNYAPLLKISAMSSAIYNQVAETYNKRIGLIGANYAKLHASVEAAGNPKLVNLSRTKKEAREFIENYKNTYVDLSGTNADFKNIAKTLQNQGDSMYLYYDYLNGLGDIVSPSEYLGLRQMLNKALQQTDFQTIQRGTYKLINALEDDWMTFGRNITKGNLLQDESIKKIYDDKLATGGKEVAEEYIQGLIRSGNKINKDLIDANLVFNKTINRYSNPAIIRQLQKFDKTLFTNKGTFGIVGREALPRDELFNTLEKNVFQHGTAESVAQFKYLLGAGPKLVGDGLKDAKLSKNGEAVFAAARVRYVWNNMLESFDKKSGVEGDIYRLIENNSDIKIGREYSSEFLEQLQKEGAEALEEARGFTIKDVETGNGIYNLKELRLAGDQVAQFDIKEFMKNLGFTGSRSDATAAKLKAIFPDKKHYEDFMNWTRYMDSISSVKISDPSTFLMRRFQLGALGAVAGGYLIGSGNEEGLLAPLAFLLLGRKFGQILGDPTAIRYLNNALGVDEKLKLMKGQKIGQGVAPVIPGLGEKKFVAGPGQLQKVGIKKRDAFAKLFNYMNEQDRDVPRVDANDIKPSEISERLLKMSMKIPQPIYDDNTIPAETTETMYAGELTESSGNAEEDNDMVAYIDTTVNNVNVHAQDLDQRDAEADAEPIEENASITEDLELQQAGTGAQNITQNTGQVNPQQFQALFPNDPTGAAIAQRGVKRG